MNNIEFYITYRMSLVQDGVIGMVTHLDMLLIL